MVKKTPVILQRNQFDCGLAALAMLFSYNDKKISIDVLRKNEESLINRDGLSLLNLKEIAIQNSSDLKIYKTSNIKAFLETYDFECPFLSYINNNHYVVVTSYKNGEVWLNDPQVGRYSIEIEEFSQRFSNFIGFLEKKEKNSKIFGSVKNKSSNIWAHIKEFKYKFFLLIIWMAAFQAINILFPNIMQKIIDQELRVGSESILLFLFIGLLYYFISKYQLNFFTGLQIDINKKLTESLIEKIFSIKLSFIELNSIGYFTNNLSNLNTIREILVNVSTMIVINFALILTYTLSLIYFSVPLTVVVYVFILIQIVSLVLLAPRIKDFIGIEIKNNIDFQNYYIESLRNYANIKSMGRPQNIIEFINSKFNRQIEIFSRRMKLQINLTSILSTLQWMIPFVVFLIGYSFRNQMSLSLGSLIAITTISTRIINPLSSSSEIYQSILMLQEVYANIENTMNQPDEVTDSGISSINYPFPIEFKNVNFAYGKDNILNDLNFKIDRHDKILVKGKSGEGKTTLIKILSTLYEPTTGAILLNNENIFNYKLSDIRRKIGYMSQDYSIVSGTIFDNITMFDDSITLDMVKEACRIVDISEFIESLPMGYFTFLSANGNVISGGQAQRICLARAILRKPELLIIDEGTSNLDKTTEENVIKKLFSLDTCIVIVSHRHEYILGITKEFNISNSMLNCRDLNEELL